ncbi:MULTISPECIES: hypothetical protein [Streptomyces]|uniref:hypothetical protein n=1 Tax=Streptomyces TaxID=1883 RepID=UPI00068A7092|nr:MULTISPECIES: hypothetical protein [Streptomyces]
MVETAAGVVEEVGKRVVGTAAVILEKAGVDVADVERRLGGQFPPSAKTLQTLAEEALTAGRAGVDLAVGMARNEAEKVFEKVGDQVTKVGVVLAYLETKLREVEEEAPAAEPGADAYGAEEPVPAPRADDLFGRGWEFEEERSSGRRVGDPIVAERVEVDAPVEVDPPVPPAAPRKAPARRSTAETSTEKSSENRAEKKTAAAGRPVAEKATAKRATAKKAAAKKTTTVKKSATAKQAAAQPEAPAKRTATRRTTVRKATSTKKPDARDE